jgi:hypothetical protein
MEERMFYRDVDHDGLELTGAQRFIDGCIKQHITFAPVSPGDTVYLYEIKYTDMKYMESVWLRERYPTKELRDMGAHYWHAHSRYKLYYWKKRSAVATSPLRDMTATNVDAHEPETLDIEPERPYEIREGEDSLDAYKRYLQEQHESATIEGNNEEES